jgi:hypothetical protein
MPGSFLECLCTAFDIPSSSPYNQDDIAPKSIIVNLSKDLEKVSLHKGETDLKVIEAINLSEQTGQAAAAS